MSHRPGVVETVESIATGRATARGHVEALLELIAAEGGRIDAWAHVDREGAMRAAERVDRGESTGALAGVAFGIKDNIDTHDMPTAYGSPIHGGKIPPRDASCVALMRAAGAVALGKTVSTEFAHRHPGPTRNPWNPAHTPGGSSSGSAAAVAAGMAPFAFGSQTTGSVIRPAAYCGVVGFKPTYGVVNASGVLANTPSFDTLGIMARTVPDVALVLSGLLEETHRPLPAPPLADLRLGLCRTPYWDEADPAAREGLESAARELERAGARVVDCEAPEAFDGLAQANLRVSGFEFSKTMAHERLYALDALSEILREGRLADGLETTPEAYADAQRTLERLRARLDAVFEEVDALVTLPAPGAAPAGLEHTGSATFNMPWTSLHVPAVTVPSGPADNGLPLGVQIVGRRYGDRRLLACAGAMGECLRPRS